MTATYATRRAPRLFSCALAATFLLTAPAVFAASIVVNSTADPIDTANPNACTLRDAITSANADASTGGCVAGSGADTITFDLPAAAIINLTDTITNPNKRAFTIKQPLTIDGTDQNAPQKLTDRIAIVANGTVNQPATVNSRVFIVQASATPTTLTHLFIRGGRAVNANGGTILNGSSDLRLNTDGIGNSQATGTAAGQGAGGVVYNQAGASVTVLGGNLGGRADRQGGCIAAAGGSGSITLSGATATSCMAGQFQTSRNGPPVPVSGAAPGDGGTIYAPAGVKVTVNAGVTNPNLPDFNRATVIDSSMASGSGGALWVAGTTVVNSSRLTGGTAFGNADDDGGGLIYNRGNLAITLSLMTGGQAPGDKGRGGAVLSNGGAITADVSSFDANFATRGGGAIALINGAAATVTRASFNNNGTPSAANDNTTIRTRQGGAVYLASGAGAFSFDTGSFTNNQAEKDGGALYADTGNIALSVLEIADNSTNATDAGNGGGGLYFTGAGTVNVDNCRLRSNATVLDNQATAASGSGGAIFNAGGTLNITDSDINRNTAPHAGAGIEVAGGTVTIDQTTLGGDDAPDGNLAGTNPGLGGAIHIDGGSVTLNNSVVAYNTATQGGGLWNSAASNVTVNNSTISNNQATGGGSGDGGGLFQASGGVSTLNFATVTENRAASDGGGVAVGATPNSQVTANSSIIAGNRAKGAGDDFVTDAVADGDGFNVFNIASPGLKGLQLFGGPTLTHPLRSGSAALDVADGGNCGSGAFATDQRGSARPNGSDCDAGAFEQTDADPVVRVQATGAQSFSPRIGDDIVVLSFRLTNTGNNSVDITGFTAQPLFNGRQDAQGFNAVLQGIIPQGFDPNDKFRYDVVLDSNGNGRIDNGEPVLGTGNTATAFDCNAPQCVLGAAGSSNRSKSFLVVLRAPQGTNPSATTSLIAPGDPGSTPGNPGMPLFAGGLLIALLGLLRVRGLRRRSQWLLLAVAVTAGLVACSKADSPPPPDPVFFGDPALAGNLRFRLQTLETNANNQIVIGQGLPVYGPVIFFR